MSPTPNISSPIRNISSSTCNKERIMATQNELLEAISDRLLQHLSQGSTSDSVLKLAEAWAWVHSPDQPHGAFVAS